MASNSSPTNTGSVLQRVWKVALSTAGGLAAATVADPALAGFFVSHPQIAGLLVAASSGIAGIEKGLSSVQPPATTQAS